MPDIIKVYRERLPAVRLIGRRYTDADRGAGGGFGEKWCAWMTDGTFGPLAALGAAAEMGRASVGCMRHAGEFEYWIGMFFPAGTPVPDGYASADIAAGEVGTCWLKGRPDNGELFGREPHEACMAKVAEAGWTPAPGGWFFERYDHARFATRDGEGKVILDYCVYLKGE